MIALRMVFLMVLLMVLLGAFAGRLSGQSAGGLAEWVARTFSPEMRQNEARLQRLSQELPSLPELRARPFASRYGYRSKPLFEQDKPQWVQIDLGRIYPIDRIVAMPVHIPDLGALGVGFGFPLRFRIEVADNPKMEGSVTVVDRTSEDVANPGRHPVIFRPPPTKGRHVRFTGTKNFRGEEEFFMALEELLVISGNQNVALSAEGKHPPKASSDLDFFPNWSVQRINDGLSALGMPVNVEKSPTQGYLSAPTGDANAEKWIELDLGKEYPVDEIRLVAVESEDFEVVAGRGFPRAETIELWGDSGSAVRFSWHTSGHRNLLGFPGGCALTIRCHGRSGRYLRVSSNGLWLRDDQGVFALAEVQAYSGGMNVALGKAVRVKDATDKPKSTGWSPEFVVDGFTSRHELIEWPEYLDLIERRSVLEKERDSLFAKMDRKVELTGRILTSSASGIGTLAVLGWGWLFVRQKTVRRRAVALLRGQIARDLHDDIGSNLGGIVLLSEMGSRHSSEPQAREDFLSIKEAAEVTSQSMQDIVWLIQGGDTSLRDLVARMRHSAQMILGDDGVTLRVDPAEFPDQPLSLFFRRHFLFAYKEALNNARKHAQATSVEVRIVIDGRDLSFEVRDNGVGFDPQDVKVAGLGLANLQRRAERLAGSSHVESQPGRGTRVFFKALMQEPS